PYYDFLIGNKGIKIYFVFVVSVFYENLFIFHYRTDGDKMPVPIYLFANTVRILGIIDQKTKSISLVCLDGFRVQNQRNGDAYIFAVFDVLGRKDSVSVYIRFLYFPLHYLVLGNSKASLLLPSFEGVHPSR